MPNSRDLPKNAGGITAMCIRARPKGARIGCFPFHPYDISRALSAIDNRSAKNLKSFEAARDIIRSA